MSTYNNGLHVAEIMQHLNPCYHARAVKDLSDQSDYIADLDREDMYTRINDVSLDLDSVAIISTARTVASDLLLSVSSSPSGWPRQTVGSNSNGVFCCHTCRFKGSRKYDCNHCKLAAKWASSQQALANVVDDAESSEIAAESEGFHLYDQRQPQHAHQPGQQDSVKRLPISVVKISPEGRNNVMHERAMGTLGELMPLKGLLNCFIA